MFAKWGRKTCSTKNKVEEDSIEQGNIQLRIISNEVNKIETKEKNNVNSDHDKGVDGEGSLAEKNLPNNSSVTNALYVSRQPSLWIHMKASHPDDLFKCEHCVRKFRILSTMEEHIKAIHANKGQRHKKPHQCSVCGKWCTRNLTLKNQMRIHDKELHYTCVYCN